MRALVGRHAIVLLIRGRAVSSGRQLCVTIREVRAIRRRRISRAQYSATKGNARINARLFASFKDSVRHQAWVRILKEDRVRSVIVNVMFKASLYKVRRRIARLTKLIRTRSRHVIIKDHRLRNYNVFQGVRLRHAVLVNRHAMTIVSTRARRNAAREYQYIRARRAATRHANLCVFLSLTGLFDHQLEVNDYLFLDVDTRYSYRRRYRAVRSVFFRYSSAGVIRRSIFVNKGGQFRCSAIRNGSCFRLLALLALRDRLSAACLFARIAGLRFIPVFNGRSYVRLHSVGLGINFRDFQYFLVFGVVDICVFVVISGDDGYALFRDVTVDRDIANREHNGCRLSVVQTIKRYVECRRYSFQLAVSSESLVACRRVAIAKGLRFIVGKYSATGRCILHTSIRRLHQVVIGVFDLRLSKDGQGGSAS